jgi:hypothetical protein
MNKSSMIEKQEYEYTIPSTKTRLKASRWRVGTSEHDWMNWVVDNAKGRMLASFATIEEVEAYIRGIEDQTTSKIAERLVDIPIW